MHEFIPDGSGQYLDLYDSDTFWSCVNPHGAPTMSMTGLQQQLGSAGNG